MDKDLLNKGVVFGRPDKREPWKFRVVNDCYSYGAEINPWWPSPARRRGGMLRRLFKSKRVKPFKHNTKSELCLQEQSDAYVLEWLRENEAPHVVNLAVSLLRAVEAYQKKLGYVPADVRRRMMESIATPASTFTCLGAIRHLDPDTPNRVFNPKNDR